MNDHLEYKVIPSKHWIEGCEEGWSWPELKVTGRHNGKPVRLTVPLADSDPGTVEVAKRRAVLFAETTEQATIGAACRGLTSRP